MLIEHHDPRVRRAAARAARGEGYEVLECSGPTDRRPCPELNGVPCGLLERADHVLNGIRGEEGRALIRHQRRELPLIGVRRLYPGRASVAGADAVQERSMLLDRLEEALDR